MFTPSRRRQGGPRPRGPRARRGVALVFVLIFVTAMAALAMSSIFMASNANLLAKSFDREHDLRFAADAALAMGKSRVNADPLVLSLPVNQLYDTLLLAQTLTGADKKPIPGITVNVYAGPTGSTSGQFGRFSSIVAEARDQRGNGVIRRLELTQESFAKFAYWSDDESNGATTIFFNNGDELWGPVWSNDTIHVGSGGATFHDEVGTAGVVSGAGYGVFVKGKKENQKPIQLPSNSTLSKLSGYASVGGFSFNPGTNGSETSVVERIEFIAVDLDGANDSTDANEGFFRVYDAKPGNATYLRGDWPNNGVTIPSLTDVEMCGDWHWAPTSIGGGLQFYPASVHPAAWFETQIKQGYLDHFGWTNKAATDSAAAERALPLKDILDHPAARCYLAGDPHLVATDRATSLGYTLAKVQRGGTDTTFTPVGLYGSWKMRGAANASVTAKRPWDATYLYPIDRSLNSGSKGVIYASGTVGLSGTLNGRITLYANGNVVILDDLRYANDPVKGVCRDILGIIADKDVVIADNALNTPPQVSATKKTATYFSLDDTKDLYIHAVIMALGTSFRAENYSSGPTDVNDCNGVDNGRGCIYLSGGIIQDKRGPVGTSSGTGFAKRYMYDRCAVVNPPPYFPTTGRFVDNRYIELDPAGFSALNYFKSLTPDP